MVNCMLLLGLPSLVEWRPLLLETKKKDKEERTNIAAIRLEAVAEAIAIGSKHKGRGRKRYNGLLLGWLEA